MGDENWNNESTYFAGGSTIIRKFPTKFSVDMPRGLSHSRLTYLSKRNENISFIYLFLCKKNLFQNLVTSNSNCLLSQDYLGWLSSFGWSSGFLWLWKARLQSSETWLAWQVQDDHSWDSQWVPTLNGQLGWGILLVCPGSLSHGLCIELRILTAQPQGSQKQGSKPAEVEAVDTHSEVTQDHFW